MATNRNHTSKIKHSKLLLLTNSLSSPWRYLASNCWVFLTQSLVDGMSCADRHNSSTRSKFLKFDLTRTRRWRGFCAAAGHSTYAAYVDVFFLDQTSIVPDLDWMSLFSFNPRDDKSNKTKRNQMKTICVDSGVIRVARGGSRAKAPPLAARLEQVWGGALFFFLQSNRARA